MAGVPWNGGAPTAGELQNWLVTVRGLQREEARRIATAYVQTGGEWTEEALSDWIDETIATVVSFQAQDADPAVGEEAARILAEREATDEARSTRNEALADQRSNAISSQVQSYYDRARIVSDAGSAFDPAQLATDLALGGQIDPETGESFGISANQVWAEIKNLSFDMGALAPPGMYQLRPGRDPGDLGRGRGDPARGLPGPSGYDNLVADKRKGNTRRYGYDNAIGGRKPKRFFTPTQALSLLSSMDEDYLIKLQQEMFEAGFYGEEGRPSWGVADTLTRQAFVDMFIEAAQRDPNKPISRVLDELAAERIGRLGPPETGPGSAAQQQLVEIPDFTPEVTSVETLNGMIDDVAQDLFGQFVPEDRKQALIAKLQEREVGLQRQQYDLSVGDIREQAQAQYAFGGGVGGGSGAPTGANEVDRFMNAISGRESGGDYDIANSRTGAYGRFQIMPNNWAPWATRAGLGPNAPRTPQNQDIVAKRIMLDYYAQYGNWRDVAVAWFGGPGAVGGSERASDGNMTIQQYADDIMNRMGQLTQGDPMAQSGLVEVGGDINAPIPRFDPAAEAEAILKAQDPAGWESHEFSDRAIEFYSLLGGVS